MLEIHEQLTKTVPHQHTLTLRFELRQKSRQLARLDSGEEVGLFLARGTVLRDGALLRAENGAIVKVKAAQETLSVVRTDDPWLLSRAAYHLGNRHVPLQIRPGELCYQHDHVLDAMVRELGLSVNVEESSFEPEAGAYGHHHGGESHQH